MEVSEVWQIYNTPDELLDDSDKTFVVPLQTEWQVLWMWVELTTSADVGNRQLVLQVYDAANDLIATLARASVVQAAGLTRYYLFAPSVVDLAAFRDTDYLTTPIPPTTFLEAGQYLRIYDNKAIAAAADHMIVQFQFAARAIV
jgi:hypothetical protein